jgi:hypothetical protein
MVGRSRVMSQRAKVLTAAIAPYDGTGSAGRALWVCVPGLDTRRARIPAAPRSACLPRKGAKPREARVRLRR